MKSRSILIVSSGNPSRNPRPVKEASTLARAGYDVTLLTGGDAARLSADKQVVSSTGCEFVFVPDSRTFAARLRRWLACRAVRLGFESIHALGASGPLLKKAGAMPADLTIVHNEVPHAIGVRLLRQGRKVAADFEDWYSEDLLPAARRHRPLRLLRKQEEFLLGNASHCTTTSQALADALHSRYGGRPAHILRNVFPLQADPFPLKTRETPPVFVWFSQTIGPGRGLESFLTAWRSTRNASSLLLVGNALPGYLSILKGIAGPERAGNISTLPFVPADELPSLLARCAVGLALEPSTPPNKDLTISNKIFQYLNAGLAVVATNTAGQREVLHAAENCGILIDHDDMASCTDQLDAIISSPSRLNDMQHSARKAAETCFCWEIEEARLLDLVREVLRP